MIEEKLIIKYFEWREIMISLKENAYKIEGKLVEIRRHLHMNPELSFKEFKTGKYVSKYLNELGITVVKDIGKTGVLGILEGAKEGKVVALRGDMDGLPIIEKNEVPYKSKNENMHACGHDVHTTCLLGAAILLSSIKDSLPGTVKFIFQPAEEINEGALAMIEDGVLENPKVDAIYGLHNSPNISVGNVGVKCGPLMSAVDTIKIKIYGESGHGAVPHKARDAIVAASAVVQSLQTIVSRKISAFETAVVSIGTIHGGQANNVISDYVEMTGTVRTYNAEVRKSIPKIMGGIIKDICSALDTEGKLEYEFTLPAVINDEYITGIGKKAVAKISGKESIVIPNLSGGGEDFALYQEKVPGCFYFLGVRNESKGIVNEWHHPKFDIDEKALPIGAGILAQSALEFLTD